MHKHREYQMTRLLLLLLLPLSTVVGQEVTPIEVSLLQEQQDRLDRIHDATVRVSVAGGVGTGMIYKEDDRYYYVVTNQHVVGNANSVGLEFTRNHYPSPRYQGTVTKRMKRSGVDVAEVRIAKVSLPEGINLPVIPLADADDPPRELFLVTSGCQAGERPSIQLTLTVKETNGLIYYIPTSRPGRSGSALVDRDGKKIYGLVAWMTGGNNSQGLAMTADVIRPFLMGTSETLVAQSDFPQDVYEIPLAPDIYVEEEVGILAEYLKQCSPNDCFDDKCPWDYQYSMTEQMQVRDNPWLKRFGGPNQPQERQPPVQPKPDAIPDNPWAKPSPTDPQPEPKAPPQERERPKLLPEMDLSKIFDRFDRLEPRIDRLGERLDEFKPLQPKVDRLLERSDPDSEEARRRLRLFERIESLPDRIIGPDDLNKFAERQSDTIIDRLRNAIWMLLRPFVWIWNIAVFLAVIWGLNTVLTPFFGPNWMGIFIVLIVNTGKRIVSAIGQGISAIWSRDEPVAIKSPRTRRATTKATEPKKPRKPRAKKTVEKDE